MDVAGAGVGGGIYLEPLGAHLVDVELGEAGGLLGLGGQVRSGNMKIDVGHDGKSGHVVVRFCLIELNSLINHKGRVSVFF